MCVKLVQLCFSILCSTSSFKNHDFCGAISENKKGGFNCIEIVVAIDMNQIYFMREIHWRNVKKIELQSESKTIIFSNEKFTIKTVEAHKYKKINSVAVRVSINLMRSKKNILNFQNTRRIAFFLKKERKFEQILSVCFSGNVIVLTENVNKKPRVNDKIFFEYIKKDLPEIKHCFLRHKNRFYMPKIIDIIRMANTQIIIMHLNKVKEFLTEEEAVIYTIDSQNNVGASNTRIMYDKTNESVQVVCKSLEIYE